MKSERLVILVSPEEKARLQELARRADISVAELVRAELPLAGRINGNGRTAGDIGVEELTEDELATLDRAAETLNDRIRRANDAIDRAFGEVEATMAHFAGKTEAPAKDAPTADTASEAAG